MEHPASVDALCDAANRHWRKCVAMRGSNVAAALHSKACALPAVDAARGALTQTAAIQSQEETCWTNTSSWMCGVEALRTWRPRCGSVLYACRTTRAAPQALVAAKGGVCMSLGVKTLTCKPVAAFLAYFCWSVPCRQSGSQARAQAFCTALLRDSNANAVATVLLIDCLEPAPQPGCIVVFWSLWRTGDEPASTSPRRCQPCQGPCGRPDDQDHVLCATPAVTVWYGRCQCEVHLMCTTVIWALLCTKHAQDGSRLVIRKPNPVMRLNLWHAATGT